MSEVELTISGRRPEPGSARLILTLGLAGMLSGLALASAFQVTKPMIERNKVRELRAGVFRVVPGSSRLQRFALRDGALVPITPEEKTADPVVHAAWDDAGAFRGYALTGAGAGFQDTIRVLWGYDPAARLVIGMNILESRETPGLGDKIYKDAAFVGNFDDLAVDPEIVVVKGGRQGANEVDAITGATISAKAVVRIVNEGNAQWLDVLPAPGQEPAPPAADAAPGEDEG